MQIQFKTLSEAKQAFPQATIRRFTKKWEKFLQGAPEYNGPYIAFTTHQQEIEWDHYLGKKVYN